MGLSSVVYGTCSPRPFLATSSTASKSPGSAHEADAADLLNDTVSTIRRPQSIYILAGWSTLFEVVSILGGEPDENVGRG